MYRILRNRVFSKDSIILMSKDDVAFSQENPFPGKIFNVKRNINVRPEAEDIDYRGENVTSDNLIAILTGNNKTTGGLPVLESTYDDNIFLYYNDHNSHDRMLNSTSFREIVLKMKEKKMFRRFFILIEAGSNSSIAKAISGISNVAVVEAVSNNKDSFSHDYNVNDKTFRTSEWSRHLIKYILSYPRSALIYLYRYTKMHTRRAIVNFYGDKKILRLPIKSFLGEVDPELYHYSKGRILHVKSAVEKNHEEKVLKSFTLCFLDLFKNNCHRMPNDQEQSEIHRLFDKYDQDLNKVFNDIYNYVMHICPRQH